MALTRRNFLEVAGAAGAFGALAACDTTTPETPADDGGEGSETAPATEPEGETEPEAEPEPETGSGHALDEYPLDPDGDDVEAKWASEEVGRDGWTRVTQEDGKTLGIWDPEKIIQVDGFAFKDLNGNGKLDIWEDWRLTTDERASALASQLTIEEAATTKFHGDTSMSSAEDAMDQLSPGPGSDLPLRGMIEAGMRQFCERSGGTESTYKDGVIFTNSLQAICEESFYGVPMWISTDPYSCWSVPSMCLTLAATFDPQIAKKAANYLSIGWRSVGIACELGPEVDVASYAQYERFSGCISDDPVYSSDIARAYADGLQSTWADEDCTEDLGWGDQSVIAMFKHYPGDACCEGGRNSHNRTGEFAVYPNDNFGVGLVPYCDGGMHLEGKTGEIGAIMPNYAISYSDDERYGDNVASAYNAFNLGIMRDAGWDGVFVSDWQVSQDDYMNGAFEGRHFGVDDLTTEERIAKGYKAGLDAFGGEFWPDELEEVTNILIDDMGEDAVLELYQESARRLFKASLNCGLWENPYLDTTETTAVWKDYRDSANAFTEELYEKSVVMLKNKGGAIQERSAKPKVYVEGDDGSGAYDEYFEVVSSAADADLALMFASAPSMGSSSSGDVNAGTAEYFPNNLQYTPYTSTESRDPSIAGETKNGEKENRSYKGKETKGDSTASLNSILSFASAAGSTPKVICVGSGNPMCFHEFADDVDVILYMPGGTNKAAMCKVVAGTVEPTGLLPYDMPANMDTVDASAEDTPHDMDVYEDSEGNAYKFTFGMNWDGVIDDERTQKYAKYFDEPVLSPEEYDFDSYKG